MLGEHVNMSTREPITVLVAGLLKKWLMETQRSREIKSIEVMVMMAGTAVPWSRGGHVAPACPCRSTAVCSSGAAGVNRGAAAS